MALKKDGNEFLNDLEGYRQLLKELHWSTTCNAEHDLTDKICDAVQKYEDRLAEAMMGNGDFTYGVGDLTTMRPSSKNLTDMLKELTKDTLDFKGKLDAAKHEGILNIIGDLCEDIDFWKYKRRFK